MKSAYTKDILRTIKRNLKRFLAIMMITALGLTAFAGINAACRDMYLAADQFYDDQNLFDIRVLSTLGLTDDDVAALQELSEVEIADGGYSETVDIVVGQQRQTAEINMISSKGMNMPYIIEGSLPHKASEIAVTQNYLDQSGKAIGDTLVIEEIFDTDTDETTTEGDVSEESNNSDEWDVDVDIEEEEEKPTFLNTEYTITAIVLNPMDISNGAGTSSFRSTTVADYSFFVSQEDIDTDVYTAVYLKIKGLAALDCYSSEYQETVQATIAIIEEYIKDQREAARYAEIVDEATEKIADAEATMNSEFSKVDQEIADAWAEIVEGKRELSDGEKQIWDGLATLNARAKTLEEGKVQLAQNRSIAEAEFAEVERAFAEKQTDINTSRDQMNAAITQQKSLLGVYWPSTEYNALVAAATTKATELMLANPDDPTIPSQVAAATTAEQGAFSAALNAQASHLPPGTNVPTYITNCIQSALGLGIAEGGQNALNIQETAYEERKAAALQILDDKDAEIASGEAAIATNRKTLYSNLYTLLQNKTELAEGESELVENEEKYQGKKTEAEEKLADAWVELADIDMTQWYVQDRTSLDSFSSLDSDLSSIEAIGTAFPILFLVVAILISLTTMTRMVEEERGLIGTYKALGFRSRAIAWKYILYALLASLAGCIIGNLLGFIALPLILIEILKVIYVIPNLHLSFDVLYGLFGTLIFAVSIVVATALACRSELKETPAALMRPKAPRAGTRIFLERIPPIWNRLKFLNKVTARNLFRYKKRFFMTLIGIAGCTALVLVGFAIRDSVTDMKPKQYEDIYQYDLLVVSADEDDFELVQRMDEDDAINDYLHVRMESMKVFNAEGASETMQITVVPEDGSLESYIATPTPDGAQAQLNDEGILITQNAAELLGLQPGDTVALQTLELDRSEATISDVVVNYLGNNIFVTQKTYESLFGTYEQNAVYAHFTDTGVNEEEYAEALLDEDYVFSSVSTRALEEKFSTDFVVLNYVIYILGILAAGLAFVVLFTLSNTNISERSRELATIKVLGFYDREVHTYANKETLILTGISVVCGLPLGYVLSALILGALKMPSIQFELVIEPLSYVLAAIISFCFAIIVNLITNRILDKINMVEALKSVE